MLLCSASTAFFLRMRLTRCIIASQFDSPSQSVRHSLCDHAHPGVPPAGIEPAIRGLGNRFGPNPPTCEESHVGQGDDAPVDVDLSYPTSSSFRARLKAARARATTPCRIPQ